MPRNASNLRFLPFYAALAVAWGALLASASPPAQQAHSPQTEAPPPHQTNSAHRLLFWTGWRDVADLTDQDLDLWKSRGVGGFICSTGHLKGMGGTQNYTGDPESELEGPEYETQRRLRDSRIVQRAKSRGMKMILGCHTVNYFNAGTPFMDWFDDAGWSESVGPKIRDFTAAARLLGFDGIAFDQELYMQKGRKATATWKWNYPGNKHTENEVRAKARERGAQLMKAIMEGYPSLEIFVYHFEFPGTWEAVVHREVNQIDDSSAPFLFTEFWDGMTSVEGYGAVHFINALFYKGPHVGTWETAFQHEYNGFFSTLSRRFSHWPYASSRIFLSPFSRIDSEGARTSAWSAPRPPEYVAGQLAAFRKWGMGGQIANYCYGGLHSFDYTPYTEALQATAVPETVDAEPPTLEIAAPAGASTRAGTPARETVADKITLQGFARDNLAIRVVRWQNNAGAKGADPEGAAARGAATMNWVVESGDKKSGFQWRMDWQIDDLPLQPGINRIAITAEDIKGLTTSQTLTVQRMR